MAIHTVSYPTNRSHPPGGNAPSAHPTSRSYNPPGGNAPSVMPSRAHIIAASIEIGLAHRMDNSVIELVQEIEKCISVNTQDSMISSLLFIGTLPT